MEREGRHLDHLNQRVRSFVVRELLVLAVSVSVL